MARLRLKDYLVIAGGILLIGLSLSFAHVNPVDSAGSAPVTVVNTPLPVTLQGTGSVSGTVAATQSGTWNVGITGTPSVSGTVAATQSGTWNVGSSGTPYTQEVTSTSCNASFCFFTFPAVPAGKRLVIQQLNLIVRPASTATIVDQAKLTTSTEPNNNSPAEFHFPMTLIGMAGVGNTFNTYAADSAVVVAYVEAGVQPALETTNRTAGSTFDFGIATISGHLVDVP